jgi:hypothetical protein
MLFYAPLQGMVFGREERIGVVRLLRSSLFISMNLQQTEDSAMIRGYENWWNLLISGRDSPCLICQRGFSEPIFLSNTHEFRTAVVSKGNLSALSA